MTDDKLYTSLSANTIMAKVTNHFQRTKLITSSTDKHYSLDSEDDFRSGCRNVSHQQQFFSELQSPGRSHYTKNWHQVSMYNVTQFVRKFLNGFLNSFLFIVCSYCYPSFLTFSCFLHLSYYIISTYVNFYLHFAFWPLNGRNVAFLSREFLLQTSSFQLQNILRWSFFTFVINIVSILSL